MAARRFEARTDLRVTSVRSNPERGRKSVTTLRRQTSDTSAPGVTGNGEHARAPDVIA